MGKNYSDTKIKCSKCKQFTKTIEPIIIEKILYRNNVTKYILDGVCSVCNKNKVKTLTSTQEKLLPKEILQAPVGSKFVNEITREGGVLPILGIIAAIAAGVTALATAGGTVASNVIASNKNAEDERHHRELDNIAKGSGLVSILPTEPIWQVCNNITSKVNMVDKELINRCICLLESEGYLVSKS